MYSGIKLCVITCLVLFLLKDLVVTCEQQVPCYFIFGDSTADSGNNANLSTPIQSNYPPYGVDFIDGPTGRFTNGRTIIDIISQLLGFNSFITPFATASVNDSLRGVNYASAGSGILVETDAEQGVISLDQQLVNHLITISRIIPIQQNPIFTSQYLKRCLYSVSIGSNDYAFNYLLPPSPSNSQRLYTPQRFADRLIQSYNRQMRMLYYLGARKVAIFGVGLLGCIPQQIKLFGTNGSACVESTNNIVRLFDYQLKQLVQQLNHEFRDAKFTFINTTSISQNPSPSIIVANAPCCTVSEFGACVPNFVPCGDRSQYAFYDDAHTTEIINIGRATRSYNAQSPFDAYPVDISHLAQF